MISGNHTPMPPSVHPGGTVTLAIATAGTQSAAPSTRIAARVLPVRAILPSFMSVPYRGIGAPVRNRIDAALAALRQNPLDVATWLLSAVLIVYLSLRAGGYDPIPRGEVGFLLWWGILLAAAAGAFSIARIGAPARWVLGLTV